MERLTNRDKKPISLTAENGILWMAIYHKLKQYENAEENGLLVRLPCKIGDTVFCVFNALRMEECKIFKTCEKPFEYSDITAIGKNRISHTGRGRSKAERNGG